MTGNGAQGVKTGLEISRLRGRWIGSAGTTLQLEAPGGTPVSLFKVRRVGMISHFNGKLAKWGKSGVEYHRLNTRWIFAMGGQGSC